VISLVYATIVVAFLITPNSTCRSSHCYSVLQEVSKATYCWHKPYHDPLSRFSPSFLNGLKTTTHASSLCTAQSPHVHVEDETSEGSADTKPMSAPPNKRMRHSLDNIDCQDAAVGAFEMMF
jgi:hypothetical protein